MYTISVLNESLCREIIKNGIFLQSFLSAKCSSHLLLLQTKPQPRQKESTLHQYQQPLVWVFMEAVPLRLFSLN